MNQPIWTATPPEPLRNGERLSREEFERRYEAMPEVKRAELIEGVVVMPSPVRWQQHSEPHANLMLWLGLYRAATPEVRLGDNATVRLDEANEMQPDAVLRLAPEHGGQTRLSEDGYIEGAPELVAEVSASSLSIDCHIKKTVYKRNGVREYIVWRVEEGVIDWFVLREGVYEPLAVTEQGQYRSEVFSGLWLDASAMVQGRFADWMAVLQQGLTSAEHTDFRDRLSGLGR